MATLWIPDTQTWVNDPDQVTATVRATGADLARWPVLNQRVENALETYAPQLTPYMAEHGYAQADVVTITPDMPQLAELNAKFLKEHTHAADEVRFFVQGRGYFWLNPDNAPVVCVVAEAGDLLNVPAGMKHWFDFGPAPSVQVVRLFTDTTGWTPQYTQSGEESRYALLSL
jgi:1,2-dihydroxy-3-keto-5-methylthiopentene dioxygenase